jgi:glutamine synthetase adenylyltransferase
MKLNQWCKTVGCSRELGMKVLQEKSGLTKLGADWFINSRGLQILKELTPPQTSNTISRANHWITESEDYEPENENEVLNNLKQIRYNIMALVSLQDTMPEADIQSEMSSVFSQDLSNIILAIDNYINSKTAGE